MRSLQIISGAIVLAATLAPGVRADDTAEVKKLTIITFSGPVEVPGVSLPAGQYRFEMADMSGSGHVVRILSADGMKVFAMFSTIPNDLPSHDLSQQTTLLMFAETPAGVPQAVKEWFYPGNSTGEEFIYPKAQAMQIARANHTSVLAQDGNEKIARIDADGQATHFDNTVAASTSVVAQAASEVAPSPTTVAPAADTIAPATGTVALTPSAESQIAQNSAAQPSDTPIGTSGQLSDTTPKLPQTASDLGLFELLSGLSFAAAVGVRQLRKRVAEGL